MKTRKTLEEINTIYDLTLTLTTQTHADIKTQLKKLQFSHP